MATGLPHTTAAMTRTTPPTLPLPPASRPASASAPGGSTLLVATGRCSLGVVLVAWSTRGLRAILLGDDAGALADDLRQRFPGTICRDADAQAATPLAQVTNLINSPRQPVNLLLDPVGTPFQQRVWQALQTIPPGQTASYTDIATRIGAPRAVRAVAAACAANALAVVIPCHRVCRRDGALSGYRWGVERKRALLAREADGA